MELQSEGECQTGHGIECRRLEAALELALAEAATNVVRHAYHGRPPGKLGVRVTRDGDQLTLAVTDEPLSWSGVASTVRCTISRVSGTL